VFCGRIRRHTRRLFERRERGDAHTCDVAVSVAGLACRVTVTDERPDAGRRDDRQRWFSPPDHSGVRGSIRHLDELGQETSQTLQFFDVGKSDYLDGFNPLVHATLIVLPGPPPSGAQ
jgi:hypothetical protein